MTVAKIKIWERLGELLRPESKDLLILAVYTIVTSLAYLIIPFATQILVNTAATGVLIQPLIIFSLALCLSLFFLGVLRVLQLWIVEILQRRIFTKIAIKISEHLPKIKNEHFHDVYAPELINRFFDTVTLQKSFGLILLEVPSAVLQILVALIVMAFYSPILLAFDIVLLIAMLSIWLLGRRALSTSLEESSEKYKVAYWLEEIARCQISLKMDKSENLIIEKLDKRLLSYLSSRQKHFQIILRQNTTNHIIQSLASAGMLGIGGFLVSTGHLSLGQLVASELIVLIILAALNTIVKKLESLYDMLTALEKVSLITDFETERIDGEILNRKDGGLEITCKDLCFGYSKDQIIFNGLNFSVPSGSRLSLIGVSGSGKTTLAHLLSGLISPDSGQIIINNQSLKALDLNSLRSKIALVSAFNEIFDGTVEENICLGRDISQEKLEEVLELFEIREDLKQYSQGLKTHLMSEGRNISLGQKQKILIARAILKEPSLVILDEAFTGMDEFLKLKIIDKIFDKARTWTIINISHDAELVSRTENIMVLEDKSIKENGRLSDLAMNKDSCFSRLFPELSRTIRRDLNQ